MSSFPGDETPTVAARPHRSLWEAALVGHYEALALLAGRCAPMVYAWLRARGSTPEDAVAQTEHFLARMLTVERPDPNAEDVERLQAFVLRRLVRYLEAGSPAAEAADVVARPAFDHAQAERRYLREGPMTPDDLFHRRWALGALELTMETLREEYVLDGKADLFVHLPQFLSFSGTEERYAEVGQLVAMSGSGLRVAVYKFRQRYREILRRIVGDTVRGEEGVDSELTKLLVSAS